MSSNNCRKCDESLTSETACPGVVKAGRGNCQSCQRQINRSPKTRHALLKKVLRRENVPEHDPLWSLDIYTAFIESSSCHYCSGELNSTGIGLDAKKRELGHQHGNVVPCCWECNQVKNAVFSYEEMLILRPALRRIRKNRPSIPHFGSVGFQKK